MTKNRIQADKDHQLCPCGSNKIYNHCCQPIIERRENAITAEALMRSRYTAFVLLNEKYLRYSWHPNTCPKNIHLDENTKWLGLKIKNTQAGGEQDNTGEVEFVARSKSINKTVDSFGINSKATSGKANRLHETSLFTRHKHRWVYLGDK